MSGDSEERAQVGHPLLVRFLNGFKNFMEEAGLVKEYSDDEPLHHDPH